MVAGEIERGAGARAEDELVLFTRIFSRTGDVAGIVRRAGNRLLLAGLLAGALNNAILPIDALDVVGTVVLVGAEDHLGSGEGGQETKDEEQDMRCSRCHGLR